MNLYTKLTSLNPDEYVKITGEKLIQDYSKYLLACLESGHSLETAKTITEWLETEI